jgi:hypothetical protein
VRGLDARASYCKACVRSSRKAWRVDDVLQSRPGPLVTQPPPGRHSTREGRLRQLTGRPRSYDLCDGSGSLTTSFTNITLP